MSWLLLLSSLSVLALGDSHTKGAVAPPPGPAYPEVLGEALGPGFAVTAAGCPGSTARAWTWDAKTLGCAFSNAYAELAGPHLPADIAVILLGTNDAVGFGTTPPASVEDYAQRMEILIRKLRSDGVRHVVLVGPPTWGDPIREPKTHKLLKGYTQALRDLAAKLSDTSMGPELLYVLGQKDHVPGTHLNAEGHRLLGEALAVQLKLLAPSLPAEEVSSPDPAAP